MIEQFPGLELSLIKATQFLWLHRQGVDAKTLASLAPLQIATGQRAPDGRFEPGEGESYIVFEEPEDLIFWQPKTGELLTFNGRAFALNEQYIVNPTTYCFDANLNIFHSVLDWLRADLDGIVVVDWAPSFDKLRDAPRIAVSEPILSNYQKWMQPQRLPVLSVIPSSERYAA